MSVSKASVTCLTWIEMELFSFLSLCDIFGGKVSIVPIIFVLHDSSFPKGLHIF